MRSKVNIIVFFIIKNASMLVIESAHLFVYPLVLKKCLIGAHYLGVLQKPRLHTRSQPNQLLHSISRQK